MGTAQITGGTGILLFCVLTSADILTDRPSLFKIGIYLMMEILAAALCIHFYTLVKYYVKTS